jgi:hypothetical protein
MSDFRQSCVRAVVTLSFQMKKNGTFEPGITAVAAWLFEVAGTGRLEACQR